jgi:hypothetical protein
VPAAWRFNSVFVSGCARRLVAKLFRSTVVRTPRRQHRSS